MSAKKKKKEKRYINLFLLLILIAVLVFIMYRRKVPESVIPDIHFGQVEVYNGGKYVWITPNENVPVNDIKETDFARDENGDLRYTGEAYDVLYGVDVSSHQSHIDWEAVKASGIDFAVIRAGGRYYGGDGELYEDDLFVQNFRNATDAGIKVGVYFFSQAVSVDEAREEAEIVLRLLDGEKPELPVFFDWERIAGSEGRANRLSNETMTECALAFCEKIKAGGCDAGVYFNLDTSYYGFNMERLTDYTFWCASPGEYPYCYYASDIWQYSFDGSVPGIDYTCDLDMMFIKK